MTRETANHKVSESLVQRFIRNLAAILTSDVLNRGTTFVIYILVARQLGTYAFGQMSLALTLFYSFQVVASFGMQTLVTREIAQDESSAAKYLANSLLLGLVTSVSATALLVGAVVALNYPAETRDLIMVTAIGLVPFTIGTICESVIRGLEKMHLIAIVQVPVNLLKVLATVYLLFWTTGTVLQVVLIIVIARFLVGVSLLIITAYQTGQWLPSLFDRSFAWSILRRSTTFVGIDAFTAWWTSLNIVLLSKLATESDVGLYNAAAQLMIPMAIFYQSVMFAAFPIMCRKYENTAKSMTRVTNRLVELLLIMAIPGTVGLLIVAEPALEFVYKGKDFVGAVDVIRLTAFILILKALTFTLGHVLLAGSREQTTLRILIVNLIVGFVLGWVLIYYFGLIGAAIAALLGRLVDAAQHYRPLKDVVARIEFGSIVWKPIIASLVMAGYLMFFRDQYLPVLILSAIAVYFTVLIAFETWMVGGFHNLRERYL